MYDYCMFSNVKRRKRKRKPKIMPSMEEKEEKPKIKQRKVPSENYD